MLKEILSKILLYVVSWSLLTVVLVGGFIGILIACTWIHEHRDIIAALFVASFVPLVIIGSYLHRKYEKKKYNISAK